jgi:hypothetical protein
MEMCRFHSDRDPNYRKVAGELGSIYRLLGDSQDTQVILRPHDGAMIANIDEGLKHFP